MAAKGQTEDVDMSQAPTTVATITRKHFEKGWGEARTSISQSDLMKFEQFRIKMDPQYAKKVGSGGRGIVVEWPNVGKSQFDDAGNDDDLYD